MEFTVHHTCNKKGGEEKVLSEFPFLSEYKPKKNMKPFLGEGYYFWDFNLDYAKVWGKNHYNNKYFICQSDILVDHEKENHFLDLAGNRKHLIGFIELLLEFELVNKKGSEGIDLCKIIDYLRTECPEAFPFEVIRAVDYNNDERVGMKIDFNDKHNQKSYTILNPRIIFSFRSKKYIVHLTEPFIAFTS